MGPTRPRVSGSVPSWLPSRPVRAFAWALAGAGLAGCGHSHSPTASREDAPGAVRAVVTLAKVGSVAKRSAAAEAGTIDLRKLVLTAVSTATPPDTVRDTSALSGNGQVTVTRVLALPALRTWVVSARTADAKDSTVHSGATMPFFVGAGDTVAASISLGARYSMYEADFLNLPDSISASAAGTGKDALRLNRLTLKVDGALVADSALASGYFPAGQTVRLYYDYLTPGSHTLTLEAYGALHAYSGVLYRATTTLAVVSGSDQNQSLSLGWVGPGTGTGSLTVILGRVGKVTLSGALPGTVIP